MKLFTQNTFITLIFTIFANKINVFMKDFVYFFKHINVPGVKIGKSSGESVEARFSCFKTYSPYGAINLGFYETDNGLKEEFELHKRFAAKRMSGEFFDLSANDVENILMEKIPNYSLILSEIVSNKIDTNIILQYINNRKEKIVYFRDEFVLLLEKLPNQFTKKMAETECVKLNLGNRFFEAQIRSKKNSKLLKRVSHGMYVKI